MISQPPLLMELKARREPSGEIRGESEMLAALNDPEGLHGLCAPRRDGLLVWTTPGVPSTFRARVRTPRECARRRSGATRQALRQAARIRLRNIT